MWIRGASIDLCFRTLADNLSLKRVNPGSGKADSPFAIHDGHEFVFQQSKWTAVTLWRMVRRYGLSYLWLQMAAKRMLSSFLHIYELQKSGTAFERPEHLMASIGLYNMTQTSMKYENKVRGSF